MILPRFIRLRDAPAYLGVDRNRFNAEIRPKLTEIPLGEQAIAFDRLDLDAWADDYKERHGRPGKAMGGRPTWDKKFRRDSSNATKSGISRKLLEQEDFEKAVEQATSGKPRDT